MTIQIDVKKLDEYLEKAFIYYDLPGVAVGIGQGHTGLQYIRAIGTKNVETKEKLNTNDIFHMASVAKLFTSTSIMLLWEKGLIDLDATVVSYLPWFEMAEETAKEITIRQLLSHTSGMPDVQDYHWEKPQVNQDALAEYVRSSEVRGAYLLWNPSEGKFSYSNMAYEILGVVIEKVSGMSFEDYVKESIFLPLGMNDSTFLTFERDLSKICAPHGKNKDKEMVVLKQYPYNRAHGPSSTLTSNLNDMEKWARVHLNQSLLKPETYELAWKKNALVPNNGEEICIGWFSRQQKGYQLFGHEGSDDGFRASFWICPELDIFIIIDSNISNAPVKKMSKEIFELIAK